MPFYRHPLLDYALENEGNQLPPKDVTPDDFERQLQLSFSSRLRRRVGKLLYPVWCDINRRSIESRLSAAGFDTARRKVPDLLTWGDRGFGTEIFLQHVARRVNMLDTVACFGCGMGGEMIQIARQLKPRRIVGYEYFNYGRAWDYVYEKLRSMGTEAVFVQCDLRLPPVDSHSADLLLSFAVLEHLHSVADTLRHARSFLKADGWFAAIWGPLWYAFSGDHIAGELGFEHGYDHVRLTADEYNQYYRDHPRNKDAISRGERTWLEMGLISFAQYDEYIAEIETNFGRIDWLGWAVSPEGVLWRERSPAEWGMMLSNNPHISAFDLLLKSAAIICCGPGNGHVCLSPA